MTLTFKPDHNPYLTDLLGINPDLISLSLSQTLVQSRKSRHMILSIDFDGNEDADIINVYLNRNEARSVMFALRSFIDQEDIEEGED